MANLKLTQLTDSQWSFYFNGIVRWYKRLQSVYKPRKNLDYDYAVDVVSVFFVYCYHFKDWLINDDAIVIRQRDVEDYITHSPALSLCADLANGGKHLVLTKESRSRVSNFKIDGSINLTIEAGSKKSSKAYFAQKIQADDKTYDSLELARNCLLEWQDFLLANKLLSRKFISIDGKLL